MSKDDFDEYLGEYVERKTTTRRVIWALSLVVLVISIIAIIADWAITSTYGHVGAETVLNPIIETSWFTVVQIPIFIFLTIVYAILSVCGQFMKSKKMRKASWIVLVASYCVLQIFDIVKDAVLLTYPVVDQWSERLLIGTTVIAEVLAWPSIAWHSLFLASMIAAMVLTLSLKRSEDGILAAFNERQTVSMSSEECKIDTVKKCATMDGKKVCEASKLSLDCKV